MRLHAARRARCARTVHMLRGLLWEVASPSGASGRWGYSVGGRVSAVASTLNDRT